jgi:hypothetical protein
MFEMIRMCITFIYSKGVAILNNSSFLKKCGELLAFGLIAGVLITGCGGGGGSTSSGFTQTYTTSAGAGDLLQFTVDTTNKTYSIKVVKTSYAASGVSSTEASKGTLTGPNAVGSYTVSASIDGFILGGEVFPLQNSFFVGHVLIAPIGGSTRKIHVFGVTNPITTLASLAGTYNDQGFGCAGRAGGLVTGGTIVCANHYGTITVTSAGAFSTCRFGNLSASTPTCRQSNGSTATTPTATGTLVATATPGVYDFKTTDGKHRGWFFAFTANGQNVAVIDHDDDFAPEFGHSIAFTQTSVASGQIDGNYFVKNNIGERHLMAVTGTTYTDISDATGATGIGTLTYNTPWTGLVSYAFNFGADSGVMDIATVGAFTYTSNTYRYIFGVGLRH